MGCRISKMKIHVIIVIYLCFFVGVLSASNCSNSRVLAEVSIKAIVLKIEKVLKEVDGKGLTKKQKKLLVESVKSDEVIVRFYSTENQAELVTELVEVFEISTLNLNEKRLSEIVSKGNDVDGDTLAAYYSRKLDQINSTLAAK